MLAMSLVLLLLAIGGSTTSVCEEKGIRFTNEEYWFTHSGVPQEHGLILASEKGEVDLVSCLIEQGARAFALSSEDIEMTFLHHLSAHITECIHNQLL